ncbi:hypothetical protein DM02DRAFT_627584 [Periconia macrospinosa]|uniref:Uncharacterized protein n=1 Tax=Periconia macrospinosa TaxID=97972 RepID=A0A2V1DWA9_9PLEO|nr:hypothetical protein DM02DRAFT_627584 [Periconia macrospinosa]
MALNGGTYAARAESGSVDPQYLYILPTLFEVTDETKRLAWSKASDESDDGNQMVDKDKYHAKMLIAISESFAHDPILEGITPTEFDAHCLEALRFFGLDVLGGIDGMRTSIETSGLEKGSISTALITVVDEDKARQYVKLGVKVNAITAMFSTPENLQDVVRDYGKVLELVAPENTHLYTMEQLFAPEWVGSRLHFREQVLEKYHKCVVNFALEDRKIA